MRSAHGTRARKFCSKKNPLRSSLESAADLLKLKLEPETTTSGISRAATRASKWAEVNPMSAKCVGNPRGTSPEPRQHDRGRNPERGSKDTECARDRALDKTLADTFPSSDPPSTIPDPCADVEENEAA
jgi:hypothetical protein